MRLRWPYLAIALALSGGWPAFAEDCHLYRLATADMSKDGAGRITVPLTVEGHPENFLIDTGGVLSMLSEEAADEIGLPINHLRLCHIVMFGGDCIDKYVDVRDIEFERLKASTAQFLILPKGHERPEISGVLGPDFLRAYDADFDFGQMKFSLFSQDHCDNRVVYWTKGDYARIPFTQDRVGHIQITVELDGKEVHAIVDTGASNSVLSWETAEDLFDIDENSPTVTTLTRKIGKAYIYPFKSMTFSGVAVANPKLVLVPDSERKMRGMSSDMLVGMDVLKKLHLYIAYGEEVIYVAPAGAN